MAATQQEAGYITPESSTNHKEKMLTFYSKED